MTKLSKNKQHEIYERYKKSNMTCLNDLYQNYSPSKAQAQNAIFGDMAKHQGYNYRILGVNCMMFSCAFMYDTREHGNINKHLVYHTRYNRYDFIVEIIEGGDK